MPPDRYFLGLDRPALEGAADFLAERYARRGAWDLSRVLVVTPVSRAGRRLQERLVARAAAEKLLLSPPTDVTVGGLPEQLYPAQRPLAGELVQRLAWRETLGALDPARRAAFLPHPPADDDFFARLALADLLRRQHQELAGDGLDFAAVRDRGGEVPGFAEHDRWAALAEAQAAYLRRLDDLGLWDAQTARRVAVEKRECRLERDLVLLGAVDLTVTLRRMLEQVAERVTVLTPSPAEWADRFDELGCLRPEAWRSPPAVAPLDRVLLAGGPAEQAARAVEALAGFGGRFRPDEISVAAADETLAPHLERALTQAGAPCRWGPGRPLSETAICRLLAAAARYAEHGRAADLAALVRHADLAERLARRIDGDWLTELDDYLAAYLPARLGPPWRGPPEKRRRVERLHAALAAWLGPLAPADEAAPRRGPARRPLGEWSEPLLDLVRGLYGERELRTDEPAERAILAVCRQLAAAAEAHAALPPSLRPEVTGPQALRLLLEGVQGARVAPPADPHAIELFGWLEAPLDDAPALVATGFHEGAVPASVVSDLFLPDALRRALGLEDNARRLARDAYALATLVGSRRDWRLIVGRRDAEGSPQNPSRLLLTGEGPELAGRVQTLFGAPPAAPPPRISGVPPAPEPGILTPPPRDGLPAPTHLSPTAFRQYLACPYRFYLSRVLRLQSVSDDVEELDGGAFGSLLHEVLQRFGRSEHRDSADADLLRRVLSELLDAAAAGLYGAAARAAVEVQLEQLRLRLDAFAARQAEQASAGWRIVHVEGDEELSAEFVVDGAPFAIRGRIDRIDAHPERGFAIWDYKSADTGEKPERKHLLRGEWVDLQLPLYRRLAAARYPGPFTLGYVNLPKDPAEVAFLAAEWSEDDLAQAETVAAEVIRGVRAGRYWPPADPPPAFSEEFAAICLDGVFERPQGEEAA